MSNQYISLKTSCRNRFLPQTHPSLSQKCFLMSDFLSSDFLESIFSAHHQYQDHQTPSRTYNSLQEVINKAQHTFCTLRQELNTLESEFMRNIASLLTDDGHYEMLNILEQEIKKCHKSIIQTPLSTMLIKELTLLLRRYDQESKRNKDYQQKRVTAILTKLYAVETDISAAITKSNASCSWRRGFGLLSTVNNNKDAPAMKREAINLNGWYIPGLSKVALLHTSRQDYVWFSCRYHFHKAAVKIIHLSRNLVLYSSTEDAEVVQHCFPDQILGYAATLNLVYSLIKTSSGLILRLSRATASAIKHFARIPLSTLTPANKVEESVQMEVFVPQHILIIASSTNLRFVNVLTRETIDLITLPSPVLGVKYITDLQLLAVACEEHLVIYRRALESVASVPKCMIEVRDILGTGAKVYLTANTVLFHTTLETSIHIVNYFKLFEIEQETIEEYNSELIGSVTFMRFGDQVNNHVNNVAINPILKKLYVQEINGSGTISIATVDMQKGLKKVRAGSMEIRPSSLAERNRPLLYLGNKEIHIERYVI